jgi:hypothetical protein
MQKDFFNIEFVRVDGKIYHLLITSIGDFISNTGNNKFYKTVQQVQSYS